MTIEMISDKFYLWKDGTEFVVTTRKRKEVFRGTKEECNQFIAAHPYGIKIAR